MVTKGKRLGTNTADAKGWGTRFSRRQAPNGGTHAALQALVVLVHADDERHTLRVKLSHDNTAVRHRATHTHEQVAVSSTGVAKAGRAMRGQKAVIALYLQATVATLDKRWRPVASTHTVPLHLLHDAHVQTHDTAG